MRNNRIGTNGFLNQHCAQTPDVESMLLARMRKIFLQQYLPTAVIRPSSFDHLVGDGAGHQRGDRAHASSSPRTTASARREWLY
jgi:hypothetical protein